MAAQQGAAGFTLKPGDLPDLEPLVASLLARAPQMTSRNSVGHPTSLSQLMPPDTDYVAIVAFYRHPGTGDGWKYVIEKKKLDPDEPFKLELLDQMVIAVGKPLR